MVSRYDKMINSYIFYNFKALYQTDFFYLTFNDFLKDKYSS